MRSGGFLQVKAIRNTPMRSPSPDYLTKSRNKLTNVTIENLTHREKPFAELLTPPKRSKFPEAIQKLMPSSPISTLKQSITYTNNETNPTQKMEQMQADHTTGFQRLRNIHPSFSPHQRHLTVTVNKKNYKQQSRNQNFPSAPNQEDIVINKTPEKYADYNNSIIQAEQSGKKAALIPQPTNNITQSNVFPLSPVSQNTRDRQISPSKGIKNYIRVLSKEKFRRPLERLQNQVYQIHQMATIPNSNNKTNSERNNLQMQNQDESQYIHQVSQKLLHLLSQIRESIQEMKKADASREQLKKSKKCKNEDQFQTFGSKGENQGNKRLGSPQTQRSIHDEVICATEVNQLRTENIKLRRQVAQLKIQLHNAVHPLTGHNLSRMSGIREQSRVEEARSNIKRFSPSPQKTYAGDSRLTLGNMSIAQQTTNFYKQKNQFLQEELELKNNKIQYIQKEKDQEINRLRQKLEVANNIIQTQMDSYKKIVAQQRTKMEQMTKQMEELSEKLEKKDRSRSINVKQNSSFEKLGKKKVEKIKSTKAQNTEILKQKMPNDQRIEINYRIDDLIASRDNKEEINFSFLQKVKLKYQSLLLKKDAQFSQKLLILFNQLKHVKERNIQDGIDHEADCQICNIFKEGICEQCLALKQELWKKEVQKMELEEKVQLLSKQLQIKSYSNQKYVKIAQSTDSHRQDIKSTDILLDEESSEHNTSKKSSKVGKNRRGKFERKKGYDISKSNVVKSNEKDMRSQEKLRQSMLKKSSQLENQSVSPGKNMRS